VFFVPLWFEYTNTVMNEVEIGGIERELSRLWSELAHPQPGDAQAAPVLRTCTLNLVVAGCGGEQADVAPLLAEVAVRHPARCIVVVGDGEGERPRAWVNITCHAAGRGQQQVCSERLILQAPAGALQQVIGSVAGLLVADLPAFLWWRGRPPASDLEKERFNRLARVVDRVVLDSASFSGEELAGAAELVRAYPRLAFGDLNWARLTSWRAAVAQVFDPPAMQAQLASLSRARIAHPGGEPSAAVRLLAGWLQSRLQPPPEVETTGSDAEVLELDLAGGTIRVPRPAPPTDAQALSEELRIVGRDAVFEQALSAATTED